LIDIGGGGAILLGGPFSISELSLTEGSIEYIGCTAILFVDAIEFLSEGFWRPFCKEESFGPSSISPLVIPFTGGANS
jgi:hypothetical protein